MSEKKTAPNAPAAPYGRQVAARHEARVKALRDLGNTAAALALLHAEQARQLRLMADERDADAAVERARLEGINAEIADAGGTLIAPHAASVPALRPDPAAPDEPDVYTLYQVVRRRLAAVGEPTRGRPGPDGRDARVLGAVLEAGVFHGMRRDGIELKLLNASAADIRGWCAAVEAMSDERVSRAVADGVADHRIAEIERSKNAPKKAAKNAPTPAAAGPAPKPAAAKPKRKRPSRAKRPAKKK